MKFEATMSLKPVERVGTGALLDGDAPQGRQLALTSEASWYAIHTKPRQEATAQAALKREGIETFYPKLRQKRVIRRRLQWVKRPLFPGYFFARFDFMKTHRLVRYSAGVTGIVGFGERPAIVHPDILGAIRSHCEEDVITAPPPKLRPGDLVQVQEGPLSGLEGIFSSELNDEERVVILLQVMSHEAYVQIPRYNVQPIG